jgi:hypothetical protein
MITTRACPDCRRAPSANRTGKPGRCVACIDAHFRRLGRAPLEGHSDSTKPRRCRCLACGDVDLISYAEIRNKNNLHCVWCACREIYERGITEEPSKWRLTTEQAAQLVLGDDFVGRGEDGKPLEAAAVAARMDYVWSPVSVECPICATPARWSVSMILGRRSDSDSMVTRCSFCSSQPLAELQEQIFRSYGLVRDHRGYARYGDRVAAHCAEPDCGAERRVSITELTRGVAPCLTCAESVDPDSPYIVYKVHFPRLRAYKSGITSIEARHDRIAAHVANGGVLLEQHEVPNREAAKTVEDRIRDTVRDFPSDCTAADFPQGGYTETWSDEGPDINLAEVVKTLAAAQMPGFDRLGRLQKYFAGKPPTIDEIVEFRRIETHIVDDREVHVVGLSEPLEQVLRKIRARRGS